MHIDIFKTASKLIEGFESVRVRNFSSPVDFASASNTALCDIPHTRDPV